MLCMGGKVPSLLLGTYTPLGTCMYIHMYIYAVTGCGNPCIYTRVGARHLPIDIQASRINCFDTY